MAVSVEYSRYATMMINIRNISFDFCGPPILQQFSCALDGFWPIAVMGASGCGKSTLLRLIAGLEYPSAGEISIGSSANAGGDCRVFSAFRDFDAFPWLTVERNVNFVLSHNGGRDEGRRRIILDDVGLGGHERKFPRQLSGGMRKRLALARAAASGANVLLLDEPF